MDNKNNRNNNDATAMTRAILESYSLHRKKKVCAFCADKVEGEALFDYKNKHTQEVCFRKARFFQEELPAAVQHIRKY